jgi:hypothetical protein
VSLRAALTALTLLAVAAPAQAQIPLIIPIPGKKKPAQVGPPPDLPPAEAEIWPYPAPDPQTWWDDPRLKPTEAADPLGGRKLRRGERLATPDNGVDASTYRLWGLMPLQWQLVRGDEMILEVWTRPANSVRQTVTRVTVRNDGKTFVQSRAGLACCEAVIGRRMGFDDILPDGSAARFRDLSALPLWRSPRDVRVEEPGLADAVCLEGTAYDVTLALPGRVTTLHRACDPAEVGEAADVLEAVLGAALGHDPRFDVVFPRGASFASARSAHRDLLASGGRLKVNPDARQGPPGHEPAPSVEAGGVPAATESPTTPPPPAPVPPPTATPPSAPPPFAPR